jgi:ring-1,2-phenylacetyl-CoA epoxidase subunit PaaD
MPALEGKGRSEDDFAFLRRERDYVNCLLVERDNRDFAHTMLRQLYFAAFMQPFWRAIAATSSDETLRGIAAKAEKEMAYHLRHSGEWVIRLGDGTDESARAHGRRRRGTAPLHRRIVHGLAGPCGSRRRGLLPDPESLRAEWDETISTVFNAAKARAAGNPRHAEGRPRRQPWRGHGPPAGRAAVHAARLSRPDLVDAVSQAPTMTEVQSRDGSNEVADFELARALEVASGVPDPEVPCVTVADLGILRSVTRDESGRIVVRLTPTYSGCPAVIAIEMAVETALLSAGIDSKIERVISPAWTTDWITEEGREKLRAYGIAPPVGSSGGRRAFFADDVIACPRCGSSHTTKVSEFGSTACKAHYRCDDCAEPFDYFKCI